MPGSYVIRVAGVVGPDLLEELAGLDAVVEPPQTVLRGPVADRAALRGLLDRLESSGLDVLELRRLAESPGTDRAASADRRPERRGAEP